jgi:MFS family permease
VPEVATHDERASIDAGSGGRQRRGGGFLVPVVVGCALFMPTLDSTVVATALPTIALSLHQEPARLNIVITAYLLSLAVFIPLSAWLADRFGARSAFQAAIAIFTLGSILCGLSHSLAAR